MDNKFLNGHITQKLENLEFILKANCKTMWLYYNIIAE